MEATISTKFATALSQATAAVLYLPLPGEPALSPVLDRYLPLRRWNISTNKNHAPFAVADALAMAWEREQVCIFLPGTRFDVYGGRHGRGGGWYDRFLSRVPMDWVRIGCAIPEQLQRVPLSREPWDELLDWVICIGSDTIEVYETNARDLCR